MRRPATPVALAWAATLAGVMSIVSALTPEFADRTRLIDGVLPPGVPEAARTVALALGLAMIFLSRGLARRKTRAWTLAVVLVIASSIAHLAKGLDVEEAAVHILLLVALLRSRRHFVAPGDPATLVPLLQVAAALAVAVPVLLVGLYDTDAYSRRIEVALALLVGALGFRALWLWLRPQSMLPAVGEERERAAELVQEHGTDSLAYFALRRDKSYFFSPSGRSFLAYRVVGGTALVAGDP
ncbi:MAG TPA: phosphatidylglycerol lysyltransferase domain-containing protein, partial [Gaiellaceae bacterium]|nr:phosphatidylglycerol lysyltransferase domain-containing protein [Gaiellaceae bacterium]